MPKSKVKQKKFDGKEKITLTPRQGVGFRVHCGVRGTNACLKKTNTQE